MIRETVTRARRIVSSLFPRGLSEGIDAASGSRRRASSPGSAIPNASARAWLIVIPEPPTSWPGPEGPSCEKRSSQPIRLTRLARRGGSPRADWMLAESRIAGADCEKQRGNSAAAANWSLRVSRKNRSATSAWSIRPSRSSVNARRLPRIESPTSKAPVRTAVATATPKPTARLLRP